MSNWIKPWISGALSQWFRATGGLRRSLQRIVSHARLAASLRYPLPASVVVMGAVEVHGTGRIRIGENVLLYPGTYLETEEDGEIVIGDNVVLSRGVHLVARSGIRIGRGAMIGEYSSLRDANHGRVEDEPLRNAPHTSRPIKVGDEVWIGRGVTVLGGVAIGQGTTIGANAVVTRSVPPGATAVGVPARVVKTAVSQPQAEETAP